MWRATVLVAAACSSSTPRPAPQPATPRSEPAPTPLPPPSAPAAAPSPPPAPSRPPPLLVATVCPRMAPVVVVTTSPAHRALCGDVDLVIRELSPLFDDPSASYLIEVIATSNTSRSPTSCTASVAVRRASTSIVTIKGGAKIAGTALAIERDCVRTLVRDLLVTKVGPQIRKAAAMSP